MSKLVLVLALMWPVHVLAETPVSSAPITTIPPGEDKIVTIEKGSPAPFSGHLFDTDTALRWANWLEQYKYRLDIDVGAEQAKCQIDLKYKEDLRVIELLRTDTIETDLRKRLLTSEGRNVKLSDAISNRSFFSSMEFGLLLGIVVTSAAAVSLAVVAN
jgi:hypothetical protein